METHVIPAEYNGPFHTSYYENSFEVVIRFPTLALAEEWIKQRKMADEIAVELEEYSE